MRKHNYTYKSDPTRGKLARKETLDRRRERDAKKFIQRRGQGIRDMRKAQGS